MELQRFSEEENAETAVEEVSEESTENQEEEQQQDIPEELAFLEEPYRSDALKEWEEMKKASSEGQEEPEAQEQETVQQTQSPPQQSNETMELRNEINNLRAQLAQMQAQAQPSQPPPSPTPQVPPKAELTPEVVGLLKKSIDAEALRLSGLTKDDLDSFEFADDGDERVERWKYAQEIAKNRVINAVQQAQANYQTAQQQLYQRQEANKRDYNEFVSRVTKEKDHPQIMAYAMGDFFNGLNPLDQFTVRSAYFRIENQTATPSDAWIVKNYYEQAKSAYRGGKSKKQVKSNSPQMPPNLPKADQLSNNSTAGEKSISNAELERLIETGQFDKIPKNIRDYLESSTAMFK